MKAFVLFFSLFVLFIECHSAATILRRFQRDVPKAEPLGNIRPSLDSDIAGSKSVITYADKRQDLVVAPSNSYGPRGRVGPVYTFVKTDPEANFKWGVRHVAGSQYGRK